MKPVFTFLFLTVYLISSNLYLLFGDIFWPIVHHYWPLFEPRPWITRFWTTGNTLFIFLYCTITEHVGYRTALQKLFTIISKWIGIFNLLMFEISYLGLITKAWHLLLFFNAGAALITGLFIAIGLKYKAFKTADLKK